MSININYKGPGERWPMPVTATVMQKYLLGIAEDNRFRKALVNLDIAFVGRALPNVTDEHELLKCLHGARYRSNLGISDELKAASRAWLIEYKYIGPGE